MPEKEEKPEPIVDEPPFDRPRVAMLVEDLTYEKIKSAIYQHVQQIYELGEQMSYLMLSTDIYEILNKRLVFKPPAHKTDDKNSKEDRSSKEGSTAHFITPYGNLLVAKMDAATDAEHTFLVE
ncbi:MAG: hypothetical protein ABI444_12255 [Candidatus Kapaibacterium sp.]|jgi:hypothetical protein